MRTWMIAFGVSMLLSTSAGAEIWICKQPDGSEVFSDSSSGPDCVRYFPKRELGKAAGGAMGQPDRDGYSQPPTSPDARSQDDAGAAVERVQQPGQITFEQFRMLSTGMTEGQVLAKLGAPSSQVTLSCTATSQGLTERHQGTTIQNESTTVTCPTLWTYIMGDGWTGDLTFFEGQLVDIQNTKTP
jgi:Protein of unknown function (DUF2845)